MIMSTKNYGGERNTKYGFFGFLCIEFFGKKISFERRLAKQASGSLADSVFHVSLCLILYLEFPVNLSHFRRLDFCTFSVLLFSNDRNFWASAEEKKIQPRRSLFSIDLFQVSQFKHPTFAAFAASAFRKPEIEEKSFRRREKKALPCFRSGRRLPTKMFTQI